METENLNMADRQAKLSTEKERNPMAITIERNAITGAYVATALVVDDEYPYTNYAWYEHQTYYGYAKSEIKTLFKQYLVKKNYSIVK